MVEVDFPLGCFGVSKLPRTRRILKNCFNNGQGQIIERLGIREINQPGGVARGGFVWNGSLYQVYSQELRKITNTTTGAYSVIGTIAGPDPIKWAIGFNDAVIVVPGDAIYTLDSSDTLTDISSNTNFVPCADVTHINGRFIYIPSNGDPAFFSDVGAAGTVQTLSFFDAEELPDKNNAVFNFRNTLYICGTDSIEPFTDGGIQPVFFQKIARSRIDVGYIGGLLEYNKTYLFVGRDKDQDFGIYSLVQGDALKQSNEFIDEILSGYTQDELEEAISGRFKMDGYDIATFTLRRHSFGFYGGQWFLLETIVNGEDRSWFGGYITQFNGIYYSAYEDYFGRLDDVSQDFGQGVEVEISTAVIPQDRTEFCCQSVQLGLSQGYNNQGSVGLQVSRDNVLFSNPVYRKTGKIGEYSKELSWNPPGGLGQYRGFMGLRIISTSHIDRSADFLKVDISA